MRPPYLQKGDKIAIVSTARRITKESIAPIATTLQEWGLIPVLGESIGAEFQQFAGEDGLRTGDFQQMLDDPSIKAILCARGGYGTIRIIDQLDFTQFQQKPKWVCGFSDITVLHSHIYQNFGVPTIHSIMPSVWDTATAEAIDTLRKALFGEELSYTNELVGENRVGNVKGILVGGNSSILSALVGSVSDVDTKDRILFIEDLDEYLYHMDRMMISLKRAGKFAKLKGLIVGGMTDMKDNEIPFGFTMEEIIFSQVKEHQYPVGFGFPCGHISDNRALRLGMECELEVTEKQMIFSQKA